MSLDIDFCWSSWLTTSSDVGSSIGRTRAEDYYWNATDRTAPTGLESMPLSKPMAPPGEAGKRHLDVFPTDC